MYGVDQCRVCGTPITAESQQARARQEEANRNPSLPEAEWRRRGYLCPPTKQQLTKHPSHGCCFTCGRQEMRKVAKPGKRLARLGLVAVTVLAVVFFVVSYMGHSGTY